jgi:hypothetical protein
MFGAVKLGASDQPVHVLEQLLAGFVFRLRGWLEGDSRSHQDDPSSDVDPPNEPSSERTPLRRLRIKVSWVSWS